MCIHAQIKTRHAAILRIIARHQERTRNSPSYDEIAQVLGVSKGCVAGNIRQMVGAGLLKRVHGSRRCIVIAAPTPSKARTA
jgi:DNA-binding MarR family transcriptional regulator